MGTDASGSAGAAYRGAVAWLDQARALGNRPGLDRVRSLLSGLGDPHRRYPVIHVAGTNGKGSTCAFIAAILRAAGRRVGEFNTPEMTLEDHIRVDGRPMGRAALVAGVAELRRAAEAMAAGAAGAEGAGAAGRPSHFELLTALAFWYFARRAVDVAVVEVGMGGALDATNVVEPQVACITHIALDHTGELGPTLDAIAWHKLGVIKRGRPLVTAERDPRLLDLIAGRCRELGAPLVVVGRDVTWQRRGGGPRGVLAGERFDLVAARGAYRGLAVRLCGEHQVVNAATAVAVVEALAGPGWRVDEPAVREGLRRARRPCRLERLAGRPLLVVDGAHNPDGAARLREALEPVRGRFERLTLVVGVMADKDIDGVVGELVPLADEVIACRAGLARAAAAARVAAAARRAGAKRVSCGGGVAAAVERALAGSGPRDAVLVAGSLYVANEARRAWRQKRRPRRPRSRPYRDACAFLEGLPRFPPGRGVERARGLLEACGRPDRRLDVVHVAGTSGKGSTCAMIDAIARAAGIRTGLFTSPHLVSYSERIQVDGRPVRGAEFARLVAAARPAAEAMLARGEPPAMFDVITAAALTGFERRGCRLAVLEVGLGGRRDATNVVTPLLCVLTSIALEHTQVLGDSVAAIAREKAGIVKSGVPVISGVKDPEARAIIAAECAARGARLVDATVAAVVWDRRAYGDGQTFTLRTPRRVYRDLRLPLLGAFQVENARLAVLAAEELAGMGLPIDAAAVAAGIAGVSWPGRLEVVWRDPLLVLDGAHSPDRCRALAAALAEHFPGRRPALVVGMMDDKAVDQMVAALAKNASLLVATRPPGHPLDPRRVAQAAAGLCPAHVCPRPGDAIRYALPRAGSGNPVVVCGSLYLVGAVKAWLSRQDRQGR